MKYQNSKAVKWSFSSTLSAHHLQDENVEVKYPKHEGTLKPEANFNFIIKYWLSNRMFFANTLFIPAITC